MASSLSHIFSSNTADVSRALTGADAGIMIHNILGELVFINAKGIELLKIDKSEIPSLSTEIILARLSDEYGSAIQSSDFPPIAALKMQKNIIDKYIRVGDKNDAGSWIKMNCVMIRNDSGNVSEVMTAFHDVTVIRNIEEYLKNATKTIRSILYSSDVSGSNYFFITDAVMQMLGYSPEELVSNPKMIMRRINREDFPLFKNFAKKLRQGKPSVVEFRVRDRRGKEHYLRNSGFPVFEGNVLVRIDGVINDITEEKFIQLELERSEERFRLLIETASDLIFNLNNFGYFVTVNSYGALALGYRPEEMIDKHFLEFVADENKAEIALAFQQMLKSDTIISFEATFTDKFGQNIVFEIQGRPTKSKGTISGLLGIARNITQRRRDEEKLRELNSKLIEANRLVSIERDRAKQQISVLEELNRLKSDFISNVSHELRTPLASVVGFSETISSDPEMPREMVMEFTNIILSEGKRLAKLINDVLDFAKMEAGEVSIFKTEFDIILLLNEITDSFRDQAAEKGIILTADIPALQVMIAADKERIMQVYQHLIANAIKFTNRGGRIKIIAQNFMKEFEVIVSDTGLGIPLKDLPNIFQKFYKASRPGTQIPGTGIGLGLVKQIVDLHKGMITVQSELNKGTTFIVKLPKANSVK